MKINEEKEIFAKLMKINDSTYDSVSIEIKTLELESFIVRISRDIPIEIGESYLFKIVGEVFKEKVVPFVKAVTPLSETNLSSSEKLDIFEKLNDGVRLNATEFLKEIEDILNNTENEIIKNIGVSIFNEYKDDFVVSHAATKYHHAYKHGLLFHTHTMLKLAKAVSETYKHINTDLVYVSIILHDLMKVKEINYQSNEYTVEGKLIGHISLCVGEIDKWALKLGYENTEEVTLLKHIIISSHGEAEFGSPKRPLIIEALVVHLIDTMDAKIEPIVESLSRAKEGTYTEQSYVNDRDRFYKHHLSK